MAFRRPPKMPPLLAEETRGLFVFSFSFFSRFLHLRLQRGIDLRIVSVRRLATSGSRDSLAFLRLPCSLLSAWPTSPSGGAVVAVPAGLRALFHSQSVREELVLVAAGALELGRLAGGRGWPLELWVSVEVVVAVVPRRQNDLGPPHLRVSSCESEPRAELIVRHSRRHALQLAFRFLVSFGLSSTKPKQVLRTH